MKKRRHEATYILRIWQEPSELVPPGEWRGLLRSLDGRQEVLFKSSDELWEHLVQSQVPDVNPSSSSDAKMDIL